MKWEVGSDANVMTTELNSLADDANAVSGEIDNNAEYLFDDVEWHHAALGYSPAAGAVVELYIVSQELDGTGYEDGDGTIDPTPNNLVGVFSVRSSTAAQTHILRGVTIPTGKFKYLCINKTGGTLASSGNTLRRKPYRYLTV